jgi:predicted amidophosphoribosyltransferase
VNVQDAFAARRSRRLDGRTAVLVDDVRTSGSTALECARVLRSAGATQIVLVTAAQA